MRSLGGKELFAGFGSKSCLGGGDDGISEENVGLALGFLEDLGEVEQFDFSGTHPWGEVSHLSVVSIVGKPHLRSLLWSLASSKRYENHGYTYNQQDLAVEQDGPGIISDVPVKDRKTDVDKDVMAALILQELAEHLQTVGVDIELVEVIQTRVTAYLQLRTDTKSSTGLLGEMNTLDDALKVSLPLFV